MPTNWTPYCKNLTIIGWKKLYVPTVLKEFNEQDDVYNILVGLNPELDQVRIQIVVKPEVLCFNKVVALIQCKESGRGMMLEPHNTDSLTLVAISSKNATEKPPI